MKVCWGCGKPGFRQLGEIRDAVTAKLVVYTMGGGDWHPDCYRRASGVERIMARREAADEAIRASRA